MGGTLVNLETRKSVPGQRGLSSDAGIGAKLMLPSTTDPLGSLVILHGGEEIVLPGPVVRGWVAETIRMELRCRLDEAQPEELLVGGVLG